MEIWKSCYFIGHREANENLLPRLELEIDRLIAEENVDLVNKYGVKGAPTLVVTDGENFNKYYGVPEIKKYQPVQKQA